MYITETEILEEFEAYFKGFKYDTTKCTFVSVMLVNDNQMKNYRALKF